MEEYRNERTIEKLDPIPGGWNHDAKSKFLEHGFLAIAGETPAAVMRTKRIDLDTLMSNLPGVIVWLGKSEARQSDGVFLLNESKSSETHREDKNLVCSDGLLKAVHGGWYHIQATWIMSGGGANNEYRHAILSLSVADSPRSEMQAMMDLSVSGNNRCNISAVVYVDDENSSIKFTISGLSNDALVTSRLDNISVHKLAAVTSAANIHAEGELDQKQTDWNETDPNKVEYLKNKPDLSVYATTDYVDTTKDDILAALGQPLKWQGPATVDTLNGGISDIEVGWAYTMTDSGELDDGGIPVDIGDEVAWTGDIWFKLGGDGGIAYINLNTSYDDAIGYIDRGRLPVMRVIANGDTHFYYPSWSNSNLHFISIQDASIHLIKRNQALDQWEESVLFEYKMSANEYTEADIDNNTLTVSGNNCISSIVLTTATTLVIAVNEQVPNFGVELDNTDNQSDVQVTVTNGNAVLFPSEVGRTTVKAGKFYQLTCVGRCWTLAEFLVQSGT